jgi:hypothetical protein
VVVTEEEDGIMAVNMVAQKEICNTEAVIAVQMDVHTKIQLVMIAAKKTR